MDKDLNQTYPLVSVVMAVYNGAAYLREAMESILNQSYTNFEFIIINDGSQDESLSIIHSYKDERIQLINNAANKGLIYSLNKGIELSQGKYIARMDADDISLKDRFQKQVSYLESHINVGVLGSDYISFNQTYHQHVTSVYQNEVIKSYLLFTATMCHPNLMLRKSILQEHSLYYSETAKHAEDYDLWCRLILHAEFSNMSETLFKYRNHPQQISNNYNTVQLDNSNRIRAVYLKKLGFNYTETELKIHNLIASNVRIASKADLISIEKWLSALIDQNCKKKLISEESFNKVIFKMWLDCCGNTNLGLWAYMYYHTSALKKKARHTIQIKLLIKCIIRCIK